MAGNLFGFLRDFAKSGGKMSPEEVQGYAQKPRKRAVSALQRMGMMGPAMKHGGSVRGDGMSRVKTKGKIC